MIVKPNTAPDPDPSLIWRLGAWLLEIEAKRLGLSRSVVAVWVHGIGFRIERRIQADFDATRPPPTSS